MARQIPLTRGMVALVDDEDYEALAAFKWNAQNCIRGFYATRRKYVAANGRNGKHPIIYMHREVMKAESGQIIDHIDGNPLNNQKSNLRFATNSQNLCNRGVAKQNKTGFKGVYWVTREQRFVASLTVGGRRITKGGFHTPEEAARAYDQLAKEHHQAFAYQNFPPESACCSAPINAMGFCSECREATNADPIYWADGSVSYTNPDGMIVDEDADPVNALLANEREYRPSFAAFRQDVTVEDALGVTCVVMIFLCLAAIFGGVS